MRVYLLAMAAGVLTLRWCPVLLPGVAVLITAVLLLAGLWGFWRQRYQRVVVLFMLGLLWANWQALAVLEDRLTDDWDGHTLWIEGRVADLPQWSQSSFGQPVVRFEVLDAQSRRTVLPARIRVSWYNPPPVQAGERWRLAVNLKQPHGVLNPHTFDYQQWLTARRVGAVGSVKAGQRVAAGQGLPAFREALRQRLLAHLPDAPAAAGIVALVLGDGSGLSREQWQTLQGAGTLHLFVISGQHISLVAGLAYGVIALLVRLGLWPLRWPWLPVACGLAWGCAVAYGALAGFGVPVQRALVMVTVALIWRVRYQSLASWTPWVWALTLIVLVEPLVSLQPGLWLSFAAVAVLLVVFAGRLGRWCWWQVWGRTQWAAALGLLPLLVALGLPVSWVGPLANAVAVPLVATWVLPLSLFGTLSLPWPQVAEPVLAVATASLAGLWAGLEQAVAWVPAWQSAPMPWWVVLLAGVAVLLLLLPRGLRARGLAVGLLVPLLWPPAAVRPSSGQAEIWLLDVGQGQAVVIQTATHVLLYDAGPALGGLDAGEQIVVPFLRGEQVTHVDKLLLSHADADHAGGARAILDVLPVAQVISGEPERHVHWVAQACEEQSWRWDGVRFWQWQWRAARDGNQASCVLLIEAQGERFLLTGDLDVAGEGALMRAWPWLTADWLVAGHHGSRTSTGLPLLQQVQPHSILLSRGRYNNYGHPHSVVVKRVERLGITLYDTALDKAVRIRLGAREPAWVMAQQRRFWR